MIIRKIVHVLSHNVVMAKLSTGKNSIVFGKGIGFKRNPGMVVEEAEISQEFLIHTSEALEHYEQILNAVDAKIIGIVEEVIAYAQEHLEGPFSEKIHAALVDHINFAVERCKKGITIANPFSYEIQLLYGEEYKVAERAFNFLNEQLDVPLPEDEIAFLAMHFHAALNHGRTSESMELVRLVAKIIEEAKRIGIKFDNSFTTVRFISHLKSLIDRVKQKRTIKNPLLGNIKEEYHDSFVRASQLTSMIHNHLRIEIPGDEVGYLALHLERFNVV